MLAEKKKKKREKYFKVSPAEIIPSMRSVKQVQLTMTLNLQNLDISR